MSNSYPLISVNGVIGQQISPLDRGFAYGDGLFETCRLTRGVIPLWALHKARLRADCERLRIPLDEALLEHYLAALLSAAALAEGIFKVTVTRGVGGRGYGLPAEVFPTYCLALYDTAINLAHQQGVVLRVCQQRLAHNASLAGIKHLNRLEQILARTEWQDTAIVDGLLMDENDHFIESTSSNLFIVRKGQLLTPNLSRCGVAGIMRQLITDVLAPGAGITTEIGSVTLSDLQSADEVFICNAVNGIWPVVEIRSEANPMIFSQGNITAALQQALRAYFSGKVI